MIQPLAPAFRARVLRMINPLRRVVHKRNALAVDAFNDHRIINVFQQRGVIGAIPKA